MIGVCTKCGEMFETTEEDANTPGVLCAKCYHAERGTVRYRSCSWCHKMNPVNTGPSAPTCSNCEHRADLPMSMCDCAKCRRFEPPTDAAGVPVTVGAAVEFDEPYDGFRGGTVAELLRGIYGPVAAVEIAPGRRVDTLCRRLHVMG